LLTLLAFLPWFFSWAGIAPVFIGSYSTLGINIGYHQYLPHLSFRCSKGFQRALAILGICALQGSPLRWPAVDRKH
jgi:hypothetical protein